MNPSLAGLVGRVKQSGRDCIARVAAFTFGEAPAESAIAAERAFTLCEWRRSDSAERSALRTSDMPRGAARRRWAALLQGRLPVWRKATRWPLAIDPAARAMAAGMLRRFGTPAWLRTWVAHSQNGMTMVGEVATPLV